MRATNNEKRTPGPVTALTNFAASTILRENRTKVHDNVHSLKLACTYSSRSWVVNDRRSAQTFYTFERRILLKSTTATMCM